MSKVKRIARITHGVECKYDVDKDGYFIDNCGIGCLVAEVGGSGVVVAAMDAVDEKKAKRRRYQKRKKTRGW